MSHRLVRTTFAIEEINGSHRSLTIPAYAHVEVIELPLPESDLRMITLKWGERLLKVFEFDGLFIRLMPLFQRDRLMAFRLRICCAGNGTPSGKMKGVSREDQGGQIFAACGGLTALDKYRAEKGKT